MRAGIVQSKLPVTLLGAGRTGIAAVRRALDLAPCLVAADGGANMAVRAGLMPEAVIGDLDSLAPEVAAALPAGRLWRVTEQETTDFEKCLTRIEAPVILGLGFYGARIDHALAVWNALVRHPGRRCVILGGGDLVFLAPPRITLALAAGTRVSLFPLGPVRGASAGLDWPIKGIGFAPDGRVGTSNRAAGPVTLEFDAPRMLVIVPRGALTSVLAALRSASVWPAAPRAPGSARGG